MKKLETDDDLGYYIEDTASSPRAKKSKVEMILEE